MKAWIEKVYGTTKNYSMLDFGILKICLFSIGVLFGVYFIHFVSTYLILFWILAIITYLYIIYKTFRDLGRG